MKNNLTRFKEDIKKLIEKGHKLELAMTFESSSDKYKQELKARLGDKYLEITSNQISFRKEYQSWYSESLALLKQILPGRLVDFAKYYEIPSNRKAISNDSYRINDYLQGTTRINDYTKAVIVNFSAAIPLFQQQLAIINAANSRFESSLFDIRQLVQADLLDSEIEAAEVLAKHKFFRAAGALAGVVLERHLSQVCTERSLQITNKNPSISDFNTILKNGAVIDLPQWRYIQHLADIRNLCDHSRVAEPSKDQVDDLISGTKKITKSVY
jgi:hypothetical protein